jgi:hypothetical protein
VLVTGCDLTEDPEPLRLVATRLAEAHLHDLATTLAAVPATGLLAVALAALDTFTSDE